MAETGYYLDTMVVVSVSARETHAHLLAVIHRLIGDGHQLSVAFPDLQAGSSLGLRLRIFGGEDALTTVQRAIQPLLTQGVIVSSSPRATPPQHAWRVFLRERATEKATAGFVARDNRHRLKHDKRPSNRQFLEGQNRASVTMLSHTTGRRFTLFIRALDVTGPEAIVSHGGKNYGLGMATPHF